MSTLLWSLLGTDNPSGLVPLQLSEAHSTPPRLAYVPVFFLLVNFVSMEQPLIKPSVV